MDLVFDIETAINEEMIQGLADLSRNFKPNANCKTGASREASVKKQREAYPDKLREKAQLHPLTGLVANFGFCELPGDPGKTDVFYGPLEEEGRLLKEAAVKLEDATRIVTCNGQSFDLWFVMIRMSVHGIQVPPILAKGLARYRYHPHIDISMFLRNWDSKRIGRMADIALLYDVFPPEEHTPKQINDAYVRGDFDYLNRIVQDDARAAAEVFMKMDNSVGFSTLQSYGPTRRKAT